MPNYCAAAFAYSVNAFNVRLYILFLNSGTGLRELPVSIEICARGVFSLAT